MNPLRVVERTLQQNARRFLRGRAVVRRDNITVATDVPCMVQRSTSALNYDPAADEQPELATIFTAHGTGWQHQDEVTVDGEAYAWRVISHDQGGTWKPHAVYIAVRGGDVTPVTRIEILRRLKDGTIQNMGQHDVYIRYANREAGSGTNRGVVTRRMSATIVSDDVDLPLRRTDVIVITGTQTTGTITNVMRFETGIQAEAVITRGYEDPTT